MIKSRRAALTSVSNLHKQLHITQCNFERLQKRYADLERELQAANALCERIHRQDLNTPTLLEDVLHRDLLNVTLELYQATPDTLQYDLRHHGMVPRRELIAYVEEALDRLK